jgi:hypothetical protein
MSVATGPFEYIAIAGSADFQIEQPLREPLLHFAVRRCNSIQGLLNYACDDQPIALELNLAR